MLPRVKIGSFLELSAFSTKQVTALLESAALLKKLHASDELRHLRPLSGKTLAMIFEKRSTRTRLSTESGMVLLGGHAAFLSRQDIHLGEGESLFDSARVLSRLADGVFARVDAHDTLTQLDKGGKVPVINGLSETHHPLQALADALTLQETFGGSLHGRTLAWVGDGNNIIHSLLQIAPHIGLNVHVATPKGYECDADIIAQCQELAKSKGSALAFTNDPLEACKGASVVSTDTWISMGEEHLREKKLGDFAGYQVTHDMMREAQDDWKFLHCLPRKPYEVDDAVFYDEKRSLVWDEAENRKWTVMSVLLAALQ